ncbi:MAG TPA: tetratricopeptide repeat protein [Pseudolabrys sp.]|nr:tetratricopeptide repeat protein [Pseudolabrys sp.]
MATGPQNERQRAQAEALQRARLALENSRAADAERLAGEVLGADSGHVEATKILGYALLMQGRADEAVDPLEKAARASRDPEIETQLAIALRQAGDSDKALTWLKRAVKRTPPFAPAFHELGFVLHSLDRSGEAVDVLRQGLAVAPMMTEMAIQLGFVCYAVNDRANAGAAFAHALAVNPAHPEAVQGLGTVLMDQGNFARAAELFRGALSADPDDTLARIALGKCLLELGDTEGGLACMRAASARGGESYGKVIAALLSSGHGRFWLHASGAAKFLKGG